MNQGKRGFTMIELLVVIAILTLLMAILFPSLASARRQAKANVCLSTLKGLGTATAIYLNENRDRFFPYRLKRIYPEATEEFVNGYNRKSPRWQWFLETEHGPVIDPLPFRRLGVPFGDEGLGLGHNEGTTMTIDVFLCPSLADERFEHDIRNGAYGYNYQYLGNTRQDAESDRWDNFPVGLHRIKSTALTVLMADSRGAGRQHGKHSYSLDPPRLAKEDKNAQYFGPQVEDVPKGLDAEYYRYSPVEMRHTGLGNVLFVDMHAEAMTLKQLGYQLSDALGITELPTGTAVPIELGPAPKAGGATNRLWNGLGVDPLARPTTSPTG